MVDDDRVEVMVLAEELVEGLDLMIKFPRLSRVVEYSRPSSSSAVPTDMANDSSPKRDGSA